MMKRLVLLLLSTLLVTDLVALQLPEGTDARVSEVTQSNGNITYAVLNEPTLINTPIGIIKAIDEIEFYESGKLKSFIPLDSGNFNTPLGSLTYRKREEIVFYESGCVLSLFINADTTIKTQAGDFEISGYEILRFYDNYKPQSLILKKETDINIDEGQITVSTTEPLLFHQSGNLKQCKVTKTLTPLNSSIGKIYPAQNSELVFFDNGKLQRIVPDEVFMIKTSFFSFLSLSHKPIIFTEESNVFSFYTNQKDFSLGNFNFQFIDQALHVFLYNNNDVFIVPNRFDNWTHNLISTSLNINISSSYLYYSHDNKFIFFMIDPYEDEGISILDDGTFKLQEIKISTPLYHNIEDIDSILINPPLVVNEQGDIVDYISIYDELDPVTDKYHYVYKYRSTIKD